MHIKVDEDLPAQATQRLRAEGYDASSVVEQKMGAGKTRRSGKWGAGGDLELKLLAQASSQVGGVTNPGEFSEHTLYADAEILW